MLVLCRVLLLATVYLVAALPARAGDAVDPKAVLLAKSFTKICMQAVPDFEKVILQAKVEDWRRVDGPEREPILTSKSPATETTWVTTGVDDLPIAVTVGRAPDHGLRRLRVSCSVTNPEVMSKGLLQTLTNLLSLPESESSNVDGDRRITAWRFRFGHSLPIIGMVESASSKPGVILSATCLEGMPD